MRRFLHFLQYHNAVPLALGIMFLGAGATFAATNPDAIYSENQAVLSVDNSYIAQKDLATYTPRVQITDVTEDEDTYYVAYTFSTIDVDEYVWKDVTHADVVKVSKADLGPYRDLGVYVTGQLKQIIDREKARLLAAQDDAKKQVSQKVVAITYGGLVGKFLDETTETLPGYTPVVEPPVAQVAAGAVAVSGSDDTESIPASVSSGLIQMLGKVPAIIAMGATYSDLGAVVTDSRFEKYGINLKLDGESVPYIQLDTSTSSTHVVRYEVFNGSSVIASAERGVIVYDPAIGPPNVVQTQSGPVIRSVVVSEDTQATSTASSTPAQEDTTPSSEETTTSATTTEETAPSVSDTDTITPAVETDSEEVQLEASSTPEQIDIPVQTDTATSTP